MGIVACEESSVVGTTVVVCCAGCIVEGVDAVGPDVVFAGCVAGFVSYGLFAGKLVERAVGHIAGVFLVERASSSAAGGRVVVKGILSVGRGVRMAATARSLMLVW